MVSIKQALRQLSYREASLDDIVEFNRQIKNEANARGAAILMATNTELALTEAIFRLLEWDDNTRGRLISEEGPAGTFSQKILLGRALRIYGEATYHNLDYIRLVRNAFAHSHVPITFETPEVVRAINELKTITPLPPVAVPSHASESKQASTPREKFESCCDVITHNLMVFAIAAFYEKHGPLDTTDPGSHRVFYWHQPLP